jgi:hypothetical protein
MIPFVAVPDVIKNGQYLDNIVYVFNLDQNVWLIHLMIMLFSLGELLILIHFYYLSWRHLSLRLIIFLYVIFVGVLYFVS